MFIRGTDQVKTKLGLDHCFGVPLPIDDDTQAVTGDLDTDALAGREPAAILGRLMQRESVAEEEITIISDQQDAAPPGIRLDFNLEMLLEFYSQRVISQENLLGLMGSFGLLARSEIPS